MSDEPVYFVVEERAGREYATIQHEHLTPGNKAIYTLRLDRLPDGEAWAKRPLAELYEVYCQLRDAGKLPPPNLADPPRAAEKRGRLLGDWWEPTWVHDKPYPPISAARGKS